MNVKLLKQKDFFLLMLGSFISLVGSQLQGFALSLYTLKLTGSAAKFASVIAITLIPKLILSPIAGVFVDRLDRKKIIIYLDILNCLIVGIFAFIYKYNNSLTLPYIYLLVILLSLTSVLYQPAVSTVIPSIVKRDKLLEANTLNSFIMSIGSFLSPLLAGFLFEIYGLFLILALNSVSFFLAFISNMFINIPKGNKLTQGINLKHFSNDFYEGINFIKKQKLLLNIILLTSIINFAVNPIFSVGIVYISKNILLVTDFQYSILQTILIASMIIAPFICGKLAKSTDLNKALYLDIILIAILIGIMAIIPSASFLNLFDSNLVPFISFIIITFIVGIAVNIGTIYISCVLQEIVPISMLGRVSTIRGTVGMSFMPLGQLIFGVLYDKISPWMCISLTALLLLSTILLFKKSFYKSKDDCKSINSPELDIN